MRLELRHFPISSLGIISDIVVEPSLIVPKNEPTTLSIGFSNESVLKIGSLFGLNPPPVIIDLTIGAEAVLRDL